MIPICQDRGSAGRWQISHYRLCIIHIPGRTISSNGGQISVKVGVRVPHVHSGSYQHCARNLIADHGNRFLGSLPPLPNVLSSYQHGTCRIFQRFFDPPAPRIIADSTVSKSLIQWCVLCAQPYAFFSQVEPFLYWSRQVELKGTCRISAGTYFSDRLSYSDSTDFDCQFPYLWINP